MTLMLLPHSNKVDFLADLTWHSEALSSAIVSTTGKLMRNVFFSDHKYITFSLNYRPIKKDRTRYKAKNKSFSKFNALLSAYKNNWLREIMNIADVTQLEDWNTFMATIHGILDKCFKKGISLLQANIHMVYVRD